MLEAGAVWIVSSANVDFVVTAQTLPAPGATVTGGTFSQSGGGKGANQAVAAARAGARVAFTGAVGADAPGADTIGELADYGIDVSGVARLDGVATGIALIVVDAAGENLIAVAPGANDRIDADSVRRSFAALREPPAVCLLALEIPLGAVVAAAECAVSVGATIVLNPAPARPLPPELFACRPVLTPNAGEALLLTGAPDVESAARILAERTTAPVVVTLGADGVLLVDAGRTERKPGLAARVVDATGAGDAFNGTLAASLARGNPIGAAVDEAQAAAAASVEHHGARPPRTRAADSA